MPSKPKMPKRKCCVSSSRCKRCPIRMLREGTLPDGYAVKKRRLVQTAPTASELEKKIKKKSKKQRKNTKNKTDKKSRPIAA